MLHLTVIVFILLTGTLINSAPINDGDTVPSESSINTKPVTLVKFLNEPSDAQTGEYKYEFETSDGQTREETGKLVKNKDGVDYLYVSGSYSYFGPDGVLYSVFYTADENGYEATGDHIPGKELEKPVVQIDRNVVLSLVG